jgi:hypothetical protein
MPTQVPEKITAKNMFEGIKSCNQNVMNIQETLKIILKEIEIIKNKQTNAVPSNGMSSFADNDNCVQDVCLELTPPKLLAIFKAQDKRCHGVGIPGHANNLVFMEWCRLVLAEFVYHTAVDMSGTRKKEILQKIARNMFRVMKSFDVQSPFPADVHFIYGRLDRKYTDWLKNERKRAREGKIVLFLSISLSNFITCFLRNLHQQHTHR